MGEMADYSLGDYDLQDYSAEDNDGSHIYDGTLVRETDKAFLVRLTTGQEEWFAKSQSGFDVDGRFHVTRWLLEKKGLI